MRFWWPITFVLAGCGGSNGPDVLDVGPPASLTVYVVTVAGFDDSRLAEYDDVDGVGYIRLRADILDQNPQMAERLLRHEFGHSIGLQHSPDPSCRMHTDAFTQDFPFCPQEAAYAAAQTFTLTVYVGLDPGLRDAAILAASRWNDVAGRTLLDVR